MFQKFLYTVGLHRICLWAEVCNLVVGIGCVTDKSKVEWKLHFLEWKTLSLVLSLDCSTLKIAFEGVEKFSGTPPPLPPRKRGLMAPWRYSRLLYSNLPATSIFNETHAATGKSFFFFFGGGGFLKRSFQFILKNQGKNFQPWKKHLSSPTLLGLFQTKCKLLLTLDGDFGWLPMHCFIQRIISVVAN